MAKCEKCGKQQGKQFVRIVQDRSGSMSSIWNSTVDSFNEYVNGLRAGEKADQIRLGLTVFDGEIDTIFKKRKLESVPEEALSEYPPRGSTSLYDAIGKSITELDGLVGKNDTALMVIITDGGENTSREFSKERIQGLIKSRELRDNWTFVYLGANQDAWSVGRSFGIAGGNTYTYSASDWGKTTSMRDLATATHTHSSGGGQSTSNFFGDAGITSTNQAAGNPTIKFDLTKSETKDDEDGSEPAKS